MSSQAPDTTADMAAILDTWLEATRAADRETASPDDDANERLKALGYVQ